MMMKVATIKNLYTFPRGSKCNICKNFRRSVQTYLQIAFEVKYSTCDCLFDTGFMKGLQSNLTIIMLANLSNATCCCSSVIMRVLYSMQCWQICQLNQEKKTTQIFSDRCCHNYLPACNVGDEGGFAPNIQSNEEGQFSGQSSFKG